MARYSRESFSYSANVRDAVEALLPGNAGVMTELEAGRSLTRNLSPIAHQTASPAVKLMAIVNPEGWHALKPAEKADIIRSFLAEATIEASTWERAGATPPAPLNLYPAMDMAVQALRALNLKPSPAKGDGLSKAFWN